ncbi:MAG: homoserine kinase [Methylococcaceae bacterium]
MAVYTLVTQSQLNDFLEKYNLGELINYSGIIDGIANSHYALITTQGAFILTLFESLNSEELPKIINLLRYLSDENSLYPQLCVDKSGSVLNNLNNKATIICRRLIGEAMTNPSIYHCQQLGVQLAKLHLKTSHYQLNIESHNNLERLKTLFAKVTPFLTNEDHELIADELAFQNQYADKYLPSGVIHGDLFRDNVLFNGDRLSGIIDFYSACDDYLLRDIAIAINDWCVEAEGVNQDKVLALLSAYQHIRPLQAIEKQQGLIFLRVTALRFWLSRLVHYYYSQEAQLSHPKDPLVFKKLLLAHRYTHFDYFH